MITPRLYAKALRASLQWRLLLLFWASFAVPGLLAALPVFAFLRRQLDHLPRTGELIAELDGATLLDLLKQAGERGTLQSIGLGGAGAALVALLTSPFLAGAAVAAARSDEPLPMGRLLAAAAELYGRMARALVAGLVPLGIAGGLSGLAFRIATRINQRATTETAADRHLWVAGAISAMLLFVAHLVVDAGRARLGAEPSRRSSFLALWAGVRLIVRRPLRAVLLGLLGAAIGLALPLVLMVLRLQIPQSSPPRLALAWMFAQAAQLAVAWGRVTRLYGLVDLSRADAADVHAGTARLELAVKSPVAAAPSMTLDPADPPPSGAAR